MVRNVPAQLKSLPTFTYTRAAQDAAVARHSRRTKQPISTGQQTKHKSVAWYQGDKDYVRRVTENMIDLARWVDEVAPDGWPLGLQYPQDVLKFALYEERIAEEPLNTEKKPRKGGQPQDLDYELWKECQLCQRCERKPDPRRISGLCRCKAGPWRNRNSLKWQEAHIDLRCEDDARGVGTYALSKFEEHEVLGELTPASDDTDSRYMLGIDNHTGNTLANVDSMRLGNWTRFINHSCVPNAKFQVVRVGSQVIVIVKTEEAIEKEQEITVDYGEKYWLMMNAKGVWCRCGESCRWYEGNKTRPKETGSAKIPKRARKKTK